MNYWLFKSEPECFSIDDLQKVQIEPWDGVRNYQARNFLRDSCQVGDLGIFYRSACKVPAAVGIFEVCSKSYPDPTQFDPNSDHPDPKSNPDNPRWFLVDVKFVSKFTSEVPLSLIKSLPSLEDTKLVQRGNRLSVMPMEKKHFDIIRDLGEQ